MRQRNLNYNIKKLEVKNAHKRLLEYSSQIYND